MKKLLITAATAALVSAGSAGFANATPATVPAIPVIDAPAVAGRLVHEVGGKHARRYLLPPRVVRHKLRKRGYHHIRRAGFIRGDYIFIARKHHKLFRLRVDGRTGRIVVRHRLRRHWDNPGVHFGNGNLTFYYGWN
ncbi:hypothetical protein [Oricola sp.]|uniref:hypothetical protein n=1 Tax=Oricola sp. TaxID=1979950 RepID=UPI003BA99A72